jgi:hypothetical protein
MSLGKMLKKVQKFVRNRKEKKDPNAAERERIRKARESNARWSRNYKRVTTGTRRVSGSTSKWSK